MVPRPGRFTGGVMAGTESTRDATNKIFGQPSKVNQGTKKTDVPAVRPAAYFIPVPFLASERRARNAHRSVGQAILSGPLGS